MIVKRHSVAVFDFLSIVLFRGDIMRAFVFLLDSFGIGALPDAEKFGDKGANTFLHIAEACAAGKADKKGIRQGPLHIPNLVHLGLIAAAQQCCDKKISGFSDVTPQGKYGAASEISWSKDTPTGHWELMGVPVLFDWGYFPKQKPCFPRELINNILKETGFSGILGDCHSSGTEIIKELGDQHVSSGQPICYTSADSVFQIAAHEETFGLNKLYEVCGKVFNLLKPYNIGRVIARPFTGKSGSYERTANRKDYALPPPAKTLLDKFTEQGGKVIAIGKISDIFAQHGISEKITAHDNQELFDETLLAAKTAADRTLVFTNFVDFDMKYGHRRDVIGYAHALEEFDRRIPEFMELMQPDDIAVITADHGCDPTFSGTDHTREYVPVLVFGQKVKAENIGKRNTFADVGQSLATHLQLEEPLEYGKSFLNDQLSG